MKKGHLRETVQKPLNIPPKNGVILIASDVPPIDRPELDKLGKLEEFRDLAGLLNKIEDPDHWCTNLQ
jgi:hypothetical protein